jgi:hypothetical protein
VVLGGDGRIVQRTIHNKVTHEPIILEQRPSLVGLIKQSPVKNRLAPGRVPLMAQCADVP